MRYVVAALFCLVPFSSYGAELVKRLKTKAVLNLKKNELVDPEIGEEVYWWMLRTRWLNFWLKRLMVKS